MATLTEGLAPPVQPAAVPTSLSFKDKAKAWSITALKASAAAILTIGAYGALIGLVAGAYLASKNFTFAVEAANLFVISTIGAIGTGALASMSNPFKVYEKIYKFLF